jgi:hypothetical protein
MVCFPIGYPTLAAQLLQLMQRPIFRYSSEIEERQRNDFKIIKIALLPSYQMVYITMIKLKKIKYPTVIH